MTSSQKVFSIGWHKTGTTSMGKALTVLGYQNCSGASGLRREMGEPKMMQALFAKNFQSIFEYADRFEAFNDVPWFMLYKELDRQYPNSKFILVTRDEQAWLESAQRYFNQSVSSLRLWIYGKPNPVDFPDVYLRRYKAHNEEVKHYFRDRLEDLLVIDIAREKQWKPICHFLGKDIPEVPFPHTNRSLAK